MTRHMLGLFNGRPGARAFRRHLSTAGMRRAMPDLATLREAGGAGLARGAGGAAGLPDAAGQGAARRISRSPRTS